MNAIKLFLIGITLITIAPTSHAMEKEPEHLPQGQPAKPNIMPSQELQQALQANDISRYEAILQQHKIQFFINTNVTLAL